MGNIKVPLEIKQFPFTKLLKMEVPSLAKLVIEVVERHKPEELLIVEIFDLLQEQGPLIAKLNVMYGVHPISLQLKPLREELLLHVSALKLQLKVASKMTTQEIVLASSLLNLSVETHLTKLRSSKNEQVILEKITSFLDELKGVTELSSAVETLGLTDIINNLSHSLLTVKTLIADRTRLISLRPKEKTLTTAKTIVNAMKYLFKQIEVAQLKHPELDYVPLFHELNDTLDKYRNLINIRAGYNLRKRLEANGAIENAKVPAKKEDEATAETQSVETPTTETLGNEVAPSMIVATNNDNVEPAGEKASENESDKTLDKSEEQKKAAASSAKHVQLPDLKNEADL